MQYLFWKRLKSRGQQRTAESAEPEFPTGGKVRDPPSGG